MTGNRNGREARQPLRGPATRPRRRGDARGRVVVALGGNALLRRGEPPEAATQRRNILVAADALAALSRGHDLVVTHGNGPQVGLLALEADAYKQVAPYPLDVLGAESQGMIGYLLAQALRARVAQPVVAVLTQVVVDGDDAAFRHPTKPIGPVYSKAEAQALAREHDWTFAPDGRHYRRVVPSPAPQRIVELDVLSALAREGAIVVCAGGGGIPVVDDGDALNGVEAVIDKDRTAALLAESLDARQLIIATDVAHVERHWGTPYAQPIDLATAAELRRTDFAAGSMGPKVEAACRFVERTGGEAAIGALPDLLRVARGESGTRIVRALPHDSSPASGRRRPRLSPSA